ncbi:C40 family peptidase [Portibacter lacus]|uniref:Hydrolase Nlp/P60 n=1 Tax=Portibacter lacus TaxID=1099794 RepID=A0AA37WC02_9BACT|nr:C40 family peptidase [Portibacter lacus]GLR15971.1 hydrolase Nlp/P60 [Portibacter lacus]
MPKKYGKKIIQSEDPFAICIVAIAPLRARPSHSEEQVSQLLIGEQAMILDRKGKHWYKVRTEWDNYVGWIDAKQIHLIDEEDFEKNKEHAAFALELVQGAMGAEFSIPVTIGATLPRFDGISCKMPFGKMTYSGQAIFADTLELDEYRLVKLGLKYIHAPYQWGGRSPFGIDGSGLIQMIFKLAGIRIPRDSDKQIALGELVDFPSDAQPADLAFFEDTKGNIVHVGMIIEESKILHAYGKVRQDYFDHHGIYNSDLGKYTHKLRIIKRVIVREKNMDGALSAVVSES